MSSNFDIQAIAKLARIKVDDTQAVELQGSIENVLGFVGQIQKADVPDVQPKDFFRLTKNRLREDVDTNEVGVTKEEILRVVPNREGDYIRVKKIIE